MLERLKPIITNYVNVNPDEITENSEFINDLGFNSYDFMSFLGEIEDEFDIEVNERDVMNLKTVGQAIEYIESLSK
ncbi:MAG: acyl carrier protein [Clostridia bacterium]|nr:acyl carrier protein [Clostridia bacterium]